jgi:hypothetical protein
MATKLTRLTHKISIKLHLMAESCTICSSRSRRPDRKLLDTPSRARVTVRVYVSMCLCVCVCTYVCVYMYYVSMYVCMYMCMFVLSAFRINWTILINLVWMLRHPSSFRHMYKRPPSDGISMQSMQSNSQTIFIIILLSGEKFLELRPDSFWCPPSLLSNGY